MIKEGEVVYTDKYEIPVWRKYTLSVQEVSSYTEMGIPFNVIRESLYGFDTNPTVWALAALNMFFRGDGKSHIENASCFCSFMFW